MLLKRLVPIFLAITMALGPMANARRVHTIETTGYGTGGDEGKKQRAQRAEERLKGEQEASKKLSEKKAGGAIADGATRVAGHQVQAIILIMMLTGVDLYRQHMEQAKITGEDVNNEEMQKNFAEAAGYIVNSGEIWASLFGAGVVGGLTAKPMKVINGLIQNSQSKQIFKNLLQGGIGTLVTFTGWELGAQLYIEATEMIESDEDYEKAQKLGSMLGKSLKYGVTGAEKNKDDWRILKMVYANMLKILWHDHALRNLWLYNAWRKRIITGEFATLVSAMVGAGAIGTTLFPGAGTIAGLGFGFVGGVITLFIPEHFKGKITAGLRKIRYGIQRVQLDSVGISRKQRRRYIQQVGDQYHNNDPLNLPQDYPANSKKEDRLMSIHFEELFRFESALQTATAKHEFAKKNNSREKEDQFLKEVEDYTRGYEAKLERIGQFYLDQKVYLETAIEDARLWPAIEDQRYEKGTTLDIIATDFENAELLSQFFTLFKEEGLSENRSEEFIRTLHRIYIFGFKKKELLRILSHQNEE